MNVGGNSGRRRPKKIRMETIESDMRVVNVLVRDVNDRDSVGHGWPTPNSWKQGEDKVEDS